MNFSPLKILLFDGSFKTTPFINRLAKGLAERHEVYIAGFNEDLPQRMPKVKYIALGSNQNKRRFVTIALYWAWRERSIKVLVKIIQALLQGNKSSIQQQNIKAALKYVQPDIIHLQWTSVISYFEEVLKDQDIPVILSQRGFHTNVKPFVYPENMAYLQAYYPLFGGFHSVSKAIDANGDKIWESHHKINRVIYTGLDFKNFTFLIDYSVTTPLELLSIGRAHWIKGYNYALHTCKFLKDQNIPFHYSIIGGAEDEELQFLISDLGLQGDVSLEHRLPQTLVYKRMQEATLLLMPSLEEGIPNVVVEAMALGLPVISTNCGGMAELITDEVEGWIVPLRDSEAMGHAIVNFSHLSIEKINEVREAARKKVEVQHSEEMMVRGMEELYRDVLERFHAENAEFDAEDAEME